MSGLTDEAKAALAEAFRIVREDKFDRFVRERVSKHTPMAPPAKDSEDKDTEDKGTGDKGTEDKGTEDKGSRSRYWGELYAD